MRKILIEDEIFELYPEFYRGVVIVSDLTNHAVEGEVQKLLEEELKNVPPQDVKQNPLLVSWDEAHRKFGSNPNKYPPSIKSLLKRIQKNPSLPFINTVVALFNYVSVKYCMPCGGDDCSAVVGDFVLGQAKGSESFIALGSDHVEHPEEGEVIYFDGDNGVVMCRRWNWRNGTSTKIETTTKQLVINVDCLPPCQKETADRARDELAGLLEKYCQAKLTTDGLHRDRRAVELPF